MFKAKRLDDYCLYTILDTWVDSSTNKTYFLIWNFNSKVWEWVSAQHFVHPNNATTKKELRREIKFID